MKRFLFYITCAAFMFAVVHTASAVQAQETSFFFTDRKLWEKTQADFENFDLSSTNVAKANEVTLPPSNLDLLGSVLTFETLNTGLSQDFTLETVEAGADFVFRLFSGNEFLSVGGVLQGKSDDDWVLTLFGGPPVFAFGVDVLDNEAGPDSISVFGSDDTLLATFEMRFEKNSFVGVVTKVPIARIEFDDDPVDNSFIDELTFGFTSVVAVTETISDMVDELVAAGALDQGEATALTALLDAVSRQLENDNTVAATQQLRAFIIEVQRLIIKGELTLEEGQPLIDSATVILNQLDG